MIAENLVNQLKSDNQQMKIELEDLNYLIEAREEELALLRQKAAYAVQLQSKLDQNLHEIAQMQDLLGEQQRQAAGATRREASMENELFQSMQMEREFYDLKDQLQSTQTALSDINHQVQDALGLYKENARLKQKIAELESNLEICMIDNGFLKEELDKFRETAGLSTKDVGA